MFKTITTVQIILFCDSITWLKCVYRTCANEILPSKYIARLFAKRKKDVMLELVIIWEIGINIYFPDA